jgi:ribosomal protein L40E
MFAVTVGWIELLIILFPVSILVTTYFNIRYVDTFLELFENCRTRKTVATRVQDFMDSRRKQLMKRPSVVHIETYKTANSSQGESTFECPKCGVMVDGTESKCSGCGVLFQKSVIFKDNVKICPQCGIENAKEAKQCLICATSLLEKEAS